MPGGRPRKNPPQIPQRPGKGCDGTAADYRRHSRRGEEPCAESRKAWAEQVHHYRLTNIYADGDPLKRHPFFFRTAKANRKSRRGQR